MSGISGISIKKPQWIHLKIRQKQKGNNIKTFERYCLSRKHHKNNKDNKNETRVKLKGIGNSEGHILGKLRTGFQLIGRVEDCRSFGNRFNSGEPLQFYFHFSFSIYLISLLLSLPFSSFSLFLIFSLLLYSNLFHYSSNMSMFFLQSHSFGNSSPVLSHFLFAFDLKISQ